MNKTTLRLRLKQTQQLNQNLQQSLQVLHMSALKLDEAVSQWLADNPFLERIETEAGSADSASPAQYVRPRDAAYNSMDEADVWATVADEPSVREQLHAQVCEYNLDEATAAGVHVLIDNLDEHGYLVDSLTDLVDNSPLAWQLSEPQLARALTALQRFEPAGIGARNLAESLTLQLRRLPENTVRQCALILVQQHLGQWQTAAQQKALCRQLPEFTAQTITNACHYIAQLNPYPCYGLAENAATNYIQPDIQIRQDEDGQWQIELIKAAWPQLKVDEDYGQMLNEAGADEACRQKWREAQTYIDNLAMRQNTVLRLAQWILRKQQDFFMFGTIGLVPLTLKETAQALGLAESTISRAVNQKYLACPQGVFALRYFFSQAVAQNEDNQVGSSQMAIKTMIAGLIQQEDSQSPYSDNELVEKLSKQGIRLARRTVAKYRETLKIPPAHQRKKIYH